MVWPVFATIFNCVSLQNALVLFFLLLMFHYLMVFYEFRNMPPGPRLTVLPVLGNVFSLNVRAEKVTDVFRRSVKLCTSFWKSFIVP